MKEGHATLTQVRQRGLGFLTLRSNPDDYQLRFPTGGGIEPPGVGRTTPVTSRVGKEGNRGRPLCPLVSLPLYREQGPNRSNPLLAPSPSHFASYGKRGMRRPSRSEQKERVEGRHENGGRPEEPPQ